MTKSQEFNKLYSLTNISTNSFKKINPNKIKVSDIAGKPTKNWKVIIKRFVTNPWAIIAFVIFMIVILLAFIIPVVSSYSAEEQISDKVTLEHVSLLHPRGQTFVTESADDVKLQLLRNKHVSYTILRTSITGDKLITYDKFALLHYADPSLSSAPFLGTDSLGRDIWTRTWTGTRNSIELALLVATIETVIGVIIGAYIGYKVGTFFEIAMIKIIAIYSSVPTLIWMAILAFVLPQGFMALVFLFVIIGWVGPVASTRLFVMRERNKEYVTAAIASGVSQSGVLFKHILPNIAGQLSIGFVHRIPAVIFGEASLAYLGISNNPDHASLGNLMTEAKTVIGNMDMLWYILLPTIIISTITISLQLISNGLNDALDPRIGTK